VSTPQSAYSARAVAGRRIGGGPPFSGSAGALGIAGLCLLALALIWVVAELVPAAQLRDAVALHDFTLLSRPHVDGVAEFLLRLLSPLPFILWGAALVAIALARERPRVALAVVTVMGMAPFTAETLKPLLAHPHVQVGAVHIGPASWPSGHSTAALALVLCAVLVAPGRLRPLVATIGAIFALAVGGSLLMLAWHMPSDVLGGYLVATLWTALAVAALRAVDRRWPARHRL
jgi:membrane-associated phospholipid phosphatase